MTGVKIMDGGCNYEVGDVLTCYWNSYHNWFLYRVQLQYKILIIILVILLVYLVSHLKVIVLIINFIESLVLVQPENLPLNLDFPVTGFSTTGIGPTVLTESIFV